MATRKALLAGTWYPGSAIACENEIKSFLKAYDTASLERQTLVGGIVPHAGWVFSGSLACNVIHCLAQGEQPDALVVFGMHLHGGSKPYIMTEGGWETPFGPLEIESSHAGRLVEQFPFIVESADNFVPDNTIEIQLPFIKYFFKKTKIVPVGVPPNQDALAIGEAAVRIAEELGLAIKVLGSTDLTHYGQNYGFSPKGGGRQALAWVRDVNDRGVIEAMEALDSEAVIQQAQKNHNACCAGAVASAITAGKAMGAQKGTILAYANSYDKSPGDSFVGYVGVVF